MSTQQTIAQQITASNIQSAHAAQQFDAIKQLFGAACFVNDGQTAERYRQELHTILDRMLDNMGTAMSLTRRSLEGGA